MIRISRLRKPNVLRRKSLAWTKELCKERQEYYQQMALYENGAIMTKPPYPKVKGSRYAHPEVQECLKEMFHGKCAYCEARLTGISYLHVEHLRPKSIYPGLAYDWDNLLVSCPICNIEKSDKFRLADGSEPLEDQANPCSRNFLERALFIDPCIDEPSTYFYFIDEYLKCVDDNPRSTYTRDVCGLAREDLNDQRRWWLASVKVTIDLYKLAHQKERIDIETRCIESLKLLASPQAPFSAMSRLKIKAEGIDLDTVEYK